MTGIDRSALAARHLVRLRGLDPAAPLTVGNGEFCFTVDATGLQTFPEAYPVGARYGEEPGTLLGTLSNWGWHSSPGRVELEPTMREYDSPHGPARYADLGGALDAVRASGQSPAEEWLRNNPHRLDLGRIGLWTGRDPLSAEALSEVDQSLDLATGIVSSAFRLDDRAFAVRTSAHPERDAIGVRIGGAGAFGLLLAFPGGSEAWGNAADWSRPDAHTSTAERTATGWRIVRRLDDTVYSVVVSAPGSRLESLGAHRFVVRPQGSPAEWDATIEFLPGSRPAAALEADRIASASAAHWSRFWEEGGALELADSDDPRAGELERRVVLSQYVSALSAGSLPPAETGLMLNSWRGKFHLEMHWWHHGWLAPWGRPELLERSLAWYEGVADRARATARGQRLPGVRWPKQVGPDGVEAPSPIGPFLIWQQPHPIHLAELVRRARPGRAALERWEPIVRETAEFMAAYAAAGPAGFELGPPLVPAQESYADTRATAKNPAFELAYWSWALEVAARWLERLGRPVPARWREVAAGLAPLPVRDGRYVALGTPPFLERTDHPSMLAALGVVPATSLVDPDTMRRTLDDVLADWRWETAWGWDFPMAAMTAARLGLPEVAVDCLLLDQPKNTYLANGHNRQDDSLPIYLPGNGALLLATGLLAAGSDTSAAVGFGPGWRARNEGIAPLP